MEFNWIQSDEAPYEHVVELLDAGMVIGVWVIQLSEEGRQFALELAQTFISIAQDIDATFGEIEKPVIVKEDAPAPVAAA